MGKLTLALLLLSLLAYGAFGFGRRSSESQREQFRFRAQQCQLERISSSQPSQRIESEGGVIEFWDQNEDQFQCAGFAAMRFTILPNSLSLPKYFPAPRLVYVEQGEGILGITYSGCPETYHSEQQLSRSQGKGMGGARGDLHQKVRRIRRGDIIAIPHGEAHWCYNDGNEELVTVSVLHLSNENNQLDQNLRAFMLAGGQPRQEQQRVSSERFRRFVRSERSSPQETFRNIMSGLDTEMMAEAFNIPTNIFRRMQQDDSRGVIVKCDQEMQFVTPDEEEDKYEEEERRRSSRSRGRYGNEDETKKEKARNGFEESSFCHMRIRQNVEVSRRADFHTRQAGRINIVNERDLPILRLIGMSAERGHLTPHAMYTPHWSMTDHRAVYALRGELHVQVVDDNGDAILDERVKEGEMFVIPQFYTCIFRAGSQGFEWIAFKTNSEPVKNPLAGFTSVIRAMPIEVVSNAYQCSPREALRLKTNRDPQSMLLSPLRTSS